MIETAGTYFSKTDRPEARKRLRDRFLVLKGEVSNKSIRAAINHGRFIVNCPHCNSAEFLFDDKRFFCTECKNEAIDGKLYKVIIPGNRLQIEALLELRPIPNRNWKYPETIDDLAQENELHIKELG